MLRFINDTNFGILSALAAIATSGVVLLILLFLSSEASSAFSDLGLSRLVFDNSWHPESKADDGLFQILPMIVGTICVSGLALVLALPIGLLAAIFTELYAPKILQTILKRVVELLSGIPSVVLGLWGLIVIVPIVQRIEGHGASILAGSLVLAIMIVPTITLNSASALASVVKEQEMQASALGLGCSAMVFDVFLPLARRAISVGVLLAAARAVGETMVVLMLCGNMSIFPNSIFDPARTLTATIALEMGYSFGVHRSTLFLIGLILMLSILGILLFTKVIKWKSRRSDA